MDPSWKSSMPSKSRSPAVENTNHERNRTMNATDVKFPQVRVKLSGRDGNAYNLLGLCT